MGPTWPHLFLLACKARMPTLVFVFKKHLDKGSYVVVESVSPGGHFKNVHKATPFLFVSGQKELKMVLWCNKSLELQI